MGRAIHEGQSPFDQGPGRIAITADELRLRGLEWQESVLASLSNQSDTHGRLIAASKVNGTNAYDLAGEKLGSIYDVVLAKDSAKAEYAIMSFGGFLGMGEKYHLLPWDVLSYSLLPWDVPHGSPQCRDLLG